VSDALLVEHLRVSFGEHPVLRDLSFAVPRGAAVTVIGPNGAGKTVLFRALIGALPYEGSVRWAPGTRLGYVPQKLDLDRNLPLSGADFLAAKARVSGAGREAVPRALALVGLDAGAARQPIGTLSGGQFQRLLLAFAMMGGPTVLLCDEPTAGVDEPGEATLFDLLHTLRRTEGLTLMLISHELSLIDSRVDQVLCLGAGGRARLGPPVEILTPQRLQEAYGTTLKFHLHDSHVR